MTSSSKSTRLKLLQTEYDVLQAQHVRLNEENVALRKKLEGVANDAGTHAATNVEARIMAMRMEDERDNMFENLERLKKKYNTLYDAYMDKVKRCKALEDTFLRQKTLTGLVMRSPIDQRMKEQEMLKERHTEKEQTVYLEKKVTKLKTDLDAAYEIIEELEFELESVDYYEMENQRLQKELRDLKTKIADARRPISTASDCSECTAYADDVDADVLERVARTENRVIETAEAESNCLRRELLRSRVKNAQKERTPRPAPPPPPPKPPKKTISMNDELLINV